MTPRYSSLAASFGNCSRSTMICRSFGLSVATDHTTKTSHGRLFWRRKRNNAVCVFVSFPHPHSLVSRTKPLHRFFLHLACDSTLPLSAFTVNRFSTKNKTAAKVGVGSLRRRSCQEDGRTELWQIMPIESIQVQSPISRIRPQSVQHRHVPSPTKSADTSLRGSVGTHSTFRNLRGETPVVRSTA